MESYLLPKFFHDTPTSQSVLFYCKENESRRTWRRREWKKRKKEEKVRREEKEEERRASPAGSRSILKAQENFGVPFPPSCCSFPSFSHLSPCITFCLLWLSVHIHAQSKTSIMALLEAELLPPTDCIAMQKSASRCKKCSIVLRSPCPLSKADQTSHLRCVTDLEWEEGSTYISANWHWHWLLLLNFISLFCLCLLIFLPSSPHPIWTLP